MEVHVYTKIYVHMHACINKISNNCKSCYKSGKKNRGIKYLKDCRPKKKEWMKNNETREYDHFSCLESTVHKEKDQK